MEERKFIKLKKEEFGIKEYIRRDLGKGKISRLDIEYTPVGEKIIIFTSKPGLVIGRKGEKIHELTGTLKRRFKLENPHIEISEIENPLFDSQIVADDIALALERMGNLKFKVIAYRKLQEIMSAGALGCELRLTGKLPSERARSWRFAEGYLKKAGDSSKEVDRAQATGLTKTGIIGVKVAIMPPDARIYDKVEINDEMRALIKGGVVEEVEEVEDGGGDEKPKKKARKKKVEKKEKVEEKEEGKDSATPESNDASTGILQNESDGTPDASEITSSESSEEAQKLEDIKTEVGEEEVLKESPDVNPEEDGTAIAIEQEIEEGVSEEDDKAIEEAEEEEKEERVEKINNSKQDKVRKSDGEGDSSPVEDTKDNRKDIKDEKLSMEDKK